MWLGIAFILCVSTEGLGLAEDPRAEFAAGSGDIGRLTFFLVFLKERYPEWAAGLVVELAPTPVGFSMAQEAKAMLDDWCQRRLSFLGPLVEESPHTNELGN
jgi:hypothetical protein